MTLLMVKAYEKADFKNFKNFKTIKSTDKCFNIYLKVKASSGFHHFF